MIEETFKAENLISIAEFPAAWLPLNHRGALPLRSLRELPHYYSFEDLKLISKEIHKGKSLSDYSGCKILGTFKNLVMARWKDEYNIDLWNQATRLLITNQTSAPIPTETTPQTGIIHTITSEWETNRIVGNPYYISYGITAPEADGQWGSLCWITESGELINRVRTAIRKDSGKILFLELKAVIR